MQGLKSILEKFASVSLEETTGVKLMNRIDSKFWFQFSRLEQLLGQLTSMYDVLEIDGTRLIEYQTIYFDTETNQMYLHHHNGFRDRYKIRRRKYETSELGFLEIKRKTNKQRTIKVRKEIPFHEGSLTIEERQFINENAPFKEITGQPVLLNKFLRFTLVNKQKNERCTIDIRLSIKNNYKEVSLDDLAILEIKRGSVLETSPLLTVLKGEKIRDRGLSKYCTGRVILEPQLKYNRFKPRILNLENHILKNRIQCHSY